MGTFNACLRFDQQAVGSSRFKAMQMLYKIIVCAAICVESDGPLGFDVVKFLLYVHIKVSCYYVKGLHATLEL